MKSILKPEDSIVAGAAVVGLVSAFYAGGIGPVAVVHATPESGSEAKALSTTRKKVAWTAIAAVAGVSLLAKDPTIAILGGAAIIAWDMHYRHAILANPQTGKVAAPGPAAYQPAENVVPFAAQGQVG